MMHGRWRRLGALALDLGFDARRLGALALTCGLGIHSPRRRAA